MAASATEVRLHPHFYRPIKGSELSPATMSDRAAYSEALELHSRAPRPQRLPVHFSGGVNCLTNASSVEGSSLQLAVIGWMGRPPRAGSPALPGRRAQLPPRFRSILRGPRQDRNPPCPVVVALLCLAHQDSSSGLCDIGVEALLQPPLARSCQHGCVRTVCGRMAL